MAIGEDDFLCQKGLLTFELALIVLIHKIPVFAVLANSRPFASIVIPAAFPEMSVANSLFAELAELPESYHRRAWCVRYSLQIRQMFPLYLVYCST
jgi:hypothetical protein